MNFAMMTDEQLVDNLAEMYPGEVPTNEQIYDWICDLKNRAELYDDHDDTYT